MEGGSYERCKIIALATCHQARALPLRHAASLEADSSFDTDHWTRRAARVTYAAVCHFGATLLFGLVTAVCLKVLGLMGDTSMGIGTGRESHQSSHETAFASISFPAHPLGVQWFGHAMALALILLFVGFLVLAYYGYVNLNWARGERD